MTRAPSSADQTLPRPPNRRRARDDRARDRVQQQVGAAGGLVDRQQARGGHDAADRGHRRGEREDDHAHLEDGDAGAARGLHVAADRVDVAAEPRAARHEVERADEAEQDQHRDRHAAVLVDDVDEQERRERHGGDADDHQRRPAGRSGPRPRASGSRAASPAANSTTQTIATIQPVLSRQELAGQVGQQARVEVDRAGLAQHLELQALPAQQAGQRHDERRNSEPRRDEALEQCRSRRRRARPARIAGTGAQPCLTLSTATIAEQSRRTRRRPTGRSRRAAGRARRRRRSARPR